MFSPHPDRKLINAIHAYQRHRADRGPLGRLLCLWGKLRHAFWSAITASDIHRDATIAATVSFPHLTGVVIHKDAVIEDNCMIMQQVTLGQTADSGAPFVAKGAYIGAGAKVLGQVRIGRNAQIGANAVVLHDVPDDATAVGVPARLVQKEQRSTNV
ncbi:serine acetyltransferase [Tabrizicola piscis]|uniref:Serine acetyltransferase n=1 Tax=Tabrizicola piscis TaxID=2494374 RepID=A0A3S8UAC5_9RHOB|nr:serine acetyltransferase [Tabrizicola piscis]AZL60499.1 serine acetyltransferase [Tabrizicola piscis]